MNYRHRCLYIGCFSMFATVALEPAADGRNSRGSIRVRATTIGVNVPLVSFNAHTHTHTSHHLFMRRFSFLHRFIHQKYVIFTVSYYTMLYMYKYNTVRYRYRTRSNLRLNLTEIKYNLDKTVYC